MLCKGRLSLVQAHITPTSQETDWAYPTAWGPYRAELNESQTSYLFGGDLSTGVGRPLDVRAVPDVLPLLRTVSVDRLPVVSDAESLGEMSASNTEEFSNSRLVRC